MMKPIYIVIIVAIVLVLGIVLLPLANNKYWKSLNEEQQCLGLMRKAKKLMEFKNIPSGSNGKLYYIVNKRKVLIFPWVLVNNEMVINKDNPFHSWNYPTRDLTDEEKAKAKDDLEKYNKKLTVKFKY